VSDHEDEIAPVRCDFCGAEDNLTFVAAPSQNGGTHLATACSGCAHSLSVAKNQLEQVVEYHRKRQGLLDQQSVLYGIVGVSLLGIGSGMQWGSAVGIMAGGGALLGVAALRAFQR